MLIVVSPAKSLDYESDISVEEGTEPQFIQQTKILIERMRQLSPPELAQLMRMSDKLADLNFGRYLSWQEQSTPQNARPAVLAFKGDVYQGLQAADFTREELDYAQQHLRILSGLYGLLRPLDMLQPYRLEMGTRLVTERGKNLYEFWGDKITRALNEQLERSQSGVLLNLASNEYFSAVRPDQIRAEVISPVFKDFKSGQYKVISFYAKKARGLMSRWIIQNRVEDRQKLRDFNLDGYYFSEAESTPSKPTFLRDAQ